MGLSKFAAPTTSGPISVLTSSSEDITVKSDVSGKPVDLEDYPINPSPNKDGAKADDKPPLFSN